MITYDSRGKTDDDGSCRAVEDLYIFLSDAQSRSQGGSGDNRACSTMYWSLACVQDHEQSHSADICEKFEPLAAAALAEIEALSAPPTEPYCNSGAASVFLVPEANRILDLLWAAIEAYANSPAAEQYAYGQEVICLQNRIDEICASLPPGSCPLYCPRPQ